MKKLLEKLGKYLFFKYSSPDIVALTRQQLGLFAEPIDLDLEPQRRRESFYSQAATLLKDEVLIQIFNDTSSTLIASAFNSAPPENMEKVRWEIDGLSKFFETLKGYASKAPQKEGEYDKYEAI